MKKLVILFLLISTVCFGYTIDVKLSWDKNPEPDIVEYHIYKTTVQGIYVYSTPELIVPNPIASGRVEAVVKIDVSGKYYFVVTAKNATKESNPSNEVGINIDCEKPTNPKNAKVNL